MTPNEPFNIFYEKFSLNPLNWFMSKEQKRQIEEDNRKLREQARKEATYAFKTLKELLKDRNYTILRGPYAYTERKTRKLALSRSDTQEKLKYKGKVSDIGYMKALFTMAHEVGHVLQWNEETDTKKRFEDFVRSRIYEKDIFRVIELVSIHKLWYELDAWVEGMQYIPLEYREEYKQYAYHSYKTYMQYEEDVYNGEMLLRNLLHQLNFQKHTMVGFSSRNKKNFISKYLKKLKF